MPKEKHVPAGTTGFVAIKISFTISLLFHILFHTRNVSVEHAMLHETKEFQLPVTMFTLKATVQLLHATHAKKWKNTTSFIVFVQTNNYVSPCVFKKPSQKPPLFQTLTIAQSHRWTCADSLKQFTFCKWTTRIPVILSSHGEQMNSQNLNK